MLSKYPGHMLYDATGVTVELGDLIKSGFTLWDFDYPSYYKGEEKEAFEQLVIDYFRFRQIGQETPARFKHYFKTRMREIMPYYIQMYESAQLLADQEDPLEGYRLTEEYEVTNTGTNTQESSGAALSERRFSDTPQGGVESLDHYLTQAEVTDSADSSQLSGSSSGTSKSKLTRYGNIGVQPLGQEINALRSAFINIDQMILKDLNCLFLGVY